MTDDNGLKPKAKVTDVEFNTGQFPVGHPSEGLWAVQVIVSPFDEEEDAATIGERLKNVVRRALEKGK